MKTKTKKKIKRVVHLVTRKKRLKKKAARRLLRGFFIAVVATCTGSLALAIATSKPAPDTHVSSPTRPQQVVAAPVPLPDQVGRASWYAIGLRAPDALTCASTRFPRGTYLKVTNLRNGRSVTCLVNDYGPQPWTGKVIDLSRGSFRQIEHLSRGTAPVEIRVVARPPGR